MIMGYGIWYLPVSEVKKKDDKRKKELAKWLKKHCGLKGELSPISGDASFRRYFRVNDVIAVDSDPQTQKNNEFVTINKRLHTAGINTFKILYQDIKQGFFVLEDLGDDTLLAHNGKADQKELYKKAIDILPKIAKINSSSFPPFDQKFVLDELHIFTEYTLEKTLRRRLSDYDQAVLKHVFLVLAQNCLDQKQVAMHRDFHSRNLMVRDDKLYVIDFQDMVCGPCLYDLASLFYDCYLKLEPNMYRELLVYAFKTFADNDMLDNISFENFIYQLKVTSLQRHIKVLGIFCRLNIRDGKSGYLKDLPRVLDYVMHECDTDELFLDFKEFLVNNVQGQLPE